MWIATHVAVGLAFLCVLRLAAFASQLLLMNKFIEYCD